MIIKEQNELIIMIIDQKFAKYLHQKLLTLLKSKGTNTVFLEVIERLLY